MNHNELLARRWFNEVWNQRRQETIAELLTVESKCYSETGVLKGPEEFIAKLYTPFLEAFPDLSVAIEGVIANGDEVVTRWAATGTHSSHGMGIPPSGRRVTFRGMTWMRFSGGKLIEGRDSFNQQGVMQALRAGESSESVTCS